MTEEKKKEPKPWKTRSVPMGRSLESFAKKFEDALNELTDEGREIHINLFEGRGAVIVGHLRRPTMELMGVIPMSQPREVETVFAPSDKTQAIVGPVIQVMQRIHPADIKRQDILQSTLDKVTHGVSVEDLQHVAGECEKFRDAYKKQHKDCIDHDDSFPQLLDKIGSMLRDKARAQLQ